MHGKNAIIKSLQVIESKTLCPPPIRIFDFCKQVNNVVGLSEIILYVIIFRRDSKFNKLILERAGLFEETMYFAVNLHIYSLSALHFTILET